MKKYLLAMYAILGLLFATSCSPENEIDGLEGTLKLSKNVVEFDNEAAEASIIVTTDVEKFTAIGVADWIDVQIQGSKITIKVEANDQVHSRTGKVLVIAGTANEVIEVKQKGIKGSAEIFPEEINLEETKGQFIVEVKANDNKWSATSDSEWLRVIAKPYKAELVLEYDENEAPHDRTALVTIIVGNDKTEVEVKQAGKIFFILPYSDLAHATFDKIVAFETERGNIQDAEHSDETNLVFTTRSKMFPVIDYVFTTDGELAKAILLPQDADMMTKNQADFNKFLENNGFQKSGLLYVDKKNAVIAQVIFIKGESGPQAHVEFKVIPVQDKDYPTFDEFPYGYLGWGDKKPQIDAYEAKNGGTFNTEISNEASGFLYYNNEGPELEARAYFVKGEGLNETVRYYLDHTKVFYQSRGEMYLTKEFLALCKKEGFVYDGFNTFHRFYNQKKSLGCALRWVWFQGMDYPVLDFHIFKLASKASEANQDFAYFLKEKKSEIHVPFLNESAR